MPFATAFTPNESPAPWDSESLYLRRDWDFYSSDTNLLLDYSKSIEEFTWVLAMSLLWLAFLRHLM